MPIFSTAGSTFFVGAARADWIAGVLNGSAFVGEEWVEIGGTTSLGSITGEWQTQDVTIPDPMSPDAPSIPQLEKVAQPARSMQITADFDPTDAGQLRMLEAEASVDAYPFRIVFPNASERLFVAFVMGVTDVMDEANTVVSLAFSLVLQSNVVRQ